MYCNAPSLHKRVKCSFACCFAIPSKVTSWSLNSAWSYSPRPTSASHNHPASLPIGLAAVAPNVPIKPWPTMCPGRKPQLDARSLPGQDKCGTILPSKSNSHINSISLWVMLTYMPTPVAGSCESRAPVHDHHLALLPVIAAKLSSLHASVPVSGTAPAAVGRQTPPSPSSLHLRLAMPLPVGLVLEGLRDAPPALLTVAGWHACPNKRPPSKGATLRALPAVSVWTAPWASTTAPILLGARRRCHARMMAIDRAPALAPCRASRFFPTAAAAPSSLSHCASGCSTCLHNRQRGARTTSYRDSRSSARRSVDDPHNAPRVVLQR